MDKEIAFYETFSNKFIKYLHSYLGEGYSIFFEHNKALDTMLQNLAVTSGLNIVNNDVYIPKLKLDIVFLIVAPDKQIKLLLIEAKYLPQLGLKDYSQLVGYLQVAKIIDIGLLLLIQKGKSNTKLSNDFHEIIALKKLPMHWLIELKTTSEQHKFRTGILHYIPQNGIDWVNTADIQGISSFENLVEMITE
jgi:hypothetical protein